MKFNTEIKLTELKHLEYCIEFVNTSQELDRDQTDGKDALPGRCYMNLINLRGLIATYIRSNQNHNPDIIFDLTDQDCIQLLINESTTLTSEKQKEIQYSFIKYLCTLSNQHLYADLCNKQCTLHDIDNLLQNISNHSQNALSSKYEVLEMEKSREYCILIIQVSFIVSCSLLFPLSLLIFIPYGIYKLFFEKKPTRKTFIQQWNQTNKSIY